MSASANDPAFPCPSTIHPATGDVLEWSVPGLTKREWFAGMAMVGLCALDANYSCRFTDGSRQTHIEGLARAAVDHADALLAELAKAESEGAP